MNSTTKTLRTCELGHKYYKSSDCPVCPVCEAAKKPEGFLSMLPAPARRALENAGITSLKALASYSEKELLKLHGFGRSSIPMLRKALEEANMKFKD